MEDSVRVILFWGCKTISVKELAINEEIRDKEVRVINADGSQMGVMPLAAAQDLAAKQNLDLVKIAPQATPPVCRVMDYGKYRFEQAKRVKEAKKNQKIVDIKEVRLSRGIDVNDFNTKLKMAIKFLTGGDKVKVTIRFRGREMAHASLSIELMNRFADGCSEVSTIEKAPKLEGRSMIMFLTPKAAK